MEAKVYRVEASISWSGRKSSGSAEATGHVREQYATQSANVVSKLYNDKWTRELENACQSAYLTVQRGTRAGLTTEQGLRILRGDWREAVERIRTAEDEVANNWSEVMRLAEDHCGSLFDRHLYPSGPLTVSASLSISATTWPAELTGPEFAAIQLEAESNLRQTLASEQEAIISEVEAIVAKVEGKGSKRPEKTRKAAIKRLNTLRHMNLLSDPAFDARVREAIRRVGGSVETPGAGFESPW